ncbi:MAG: DUF4249 domain-containing protein [Bacteroidota bacterium]
MSKRKLKYKTLAQLGIAINLLLLGCTEPFVAPDLDFQEILVIDAIITTELKTQEIFLSRTFASDEELKFESNANVRLIDDSGNEIIFEETEPGRYVSQVEFGALPNRSYSLRITTENGSSFSAGPSQIVGDGILEEVSASVSTNQNGTEGLSIEVNGRGIDDNASSFRYDYVETYEVISPFFSNSDLVIVSENPIVFDVVPKTRQEQTCYRTVSSNDILITSSESLNSNQIEKFEVKFIPKNDFAISHRYSVLVNQYVQSPVVQSFYEDLKEFSSLTTLFAQTQPGFVRGNIEADENVSERVLGVFEVASVSSQRIFFNRSDFFPEDPLPDHIIECNSVELPSNSAFLFRLIDAGTHKLVGEDIGSFTVVERGCVDCTVYGTNIRPDFWVD